MGKAQNQQGNPRGPSGGLTRALALGTPRETGRAYPAETREPQSPRVLRRNTVDQEPETDQSDGDREVSYVKMSPHLDWDERKTNRATRGAHLAD